MLPNLAFKVIWTNSLDQFFPRLWNALQEPHFR